MTKATDSKRLRRETAGAFRGRSLVIELGERSIIIRQKGCRRGYEVDYESIFSLGAKKEAERVRLEKKKKQLLYKSRSRI